MTPTPRREPPEMRRVLMSEELFLALGASRVDWGKPDANDYYTPTVYRDDRSEAVGLALSELEEAVAGLKEHGTDGWECRWSCGPDGDDCDDEADHASLVGRAAVIQLIRDKQGRNEE